MNMRPIERPILRTWSKGSRTFLRWQQDSNRRFAYGSRVSSRLLDRPAPSAIRQTSASASLWCQCQSIQSQAAISALGAESPDLGRRSPPTGMTARAAERQAALLSSAD